MVVGGEKSPVSISNPEWLEEGRMSNIKIIDGDITKTEVDAIVNAANPKMLGGGGVDGAIHRAAGPKLLEACRRVKPVNGIRCPIGEAQITEAGNLSAKYVIHTVGPRYRSDPDPEKTLRSAYENCLTLALENDCKSIAFPAISCGAYGYPLKEAGAIAIDICNNPRWKRLQIQFHLMRSATLLIWSRELEKRTT